MSILPSDIIEWAHNILDYIHIQDKYIQGFPLNYFISCNNSARISNYIVPIGTTGYSVPKNIILHHIVADISHYMILYSRSKMYLNEIYNSQFPYFLISDVNEFRRFGVTSNSIRMIDALLDGIRIKYE